MSTTLISGGGLTEPVSVDDNGGSLTVDGSVTASEPVNTSVTQTLNVLNEEITINVPDGYNSVTAIINATAFSATLAFLQGSAASGSFTTFNPAFSFSSGGWISSLGYVAGTNRQVLSFPVVSGEPFSIVVAAYTSGSADVELIASTSKAIGAPLTNTELRASSLVVNTELPTAAFLADNTSNPTVPAVGSFGMMWDGATWDRQPGTSVDGQLVNLGANNDITATNLDIRDLTSISDSIKTVETKSATCTQTQVPDNASSVTILASNANRLGASIINTSTVTLFLRLNVAAATTDNYTVALAAGAYYEVPFNYSGAITGIWASDPNTGNANVSEFTVPL